MLPRHQEKQIRNFWITGYVGVELFTHRCLGSLCCIHVTHPAVRMKFYASTFDDWRWYVFFRPSFVYFLDILPSKSVTPTNLLKKPMM